MPISLASPVNSNHYLSGTYTSGLCNGYLQNSGTPTRNTSPAYIRRGDYSQKFQALAGLNGALIRVDSSSVIDSVVSGQNVRFLVEAYVMSGYIMISADGIAGSTVIYSSTVDAGWITVNTTFPCMQNSLGIRVFATNSGDTYFLDVCRVEPYVEIKPEYDFELQDKVNRSEKRTLNGTLYSYQFAKWNRWEVPVSFVNSYDRSLVNSWWESQRILYFYDEDHTAFPSSYYIVKLMNKTSPFDKYQKPYFLQKFRGDLILETL